MSDTDSTAAAADTAAGGVPRLRWVPCRACAGNGTVQVSDLTEQFRKAGQPFVVIGPCPLCAGARGALVEVEQ